MTTPHKLEIAHSSQADETSGLAVAGLLAPAEPLAGRPQPLGANAGLAPWRLWPDTGGTRYTLEPQDVGATIRADTDHGIASLYLERDLDLERTPYLYFRWKTTRHYVGLDERRIGDFDFPLRVSVLHRSGIGNWSTRSISYAVASGRSPGEHFVHPRNSRVVLVVIANRASREDTWHSVAVDVRADFDRHLELRTGRAHGLAITVDNDSAGQSTTTWIADLALATGPRLAGTRVSCIRLPPFG